MAPSRPIPIVLCGRTEQIGSGVIENLKPDFEVVLFTLTLSSALTEIPSVLSGTAPSSLSSTLGTGNYSNIPRAVLTGGAYDDEAVEAIQQKLQEIGKPVPILRADLSVPMPPVGPEYGKIIMQRARKGLERLESEGKLDEGGQDGVFLY